MLIADSFRIAKMWKHPSGCGCNEMEKNECWYAKQHGKVCAVSSQQRVPSLQPSRGDISPSLPLAPPPTPDLNSLSVKITSRCSTRFPCCRAMQWSVRVHIWKWWWHTPVIPVFGDWDRKITSLKPPGLYNEGPRHQGLTVYLSGTEFCTCSRSWLLSPTWGKKKKKTD